MAKRDYYEILGIEKGSSDAEIKKAYRKAAMKYHPDKFANAEEKEKKESEDKFKEINEAYQVLSDSSKKQQYDQYGHAAFEQGAGSGGFGGGYGDFSDLGDIFSEFFGGGFSSNFGGGSSRRRYQEPGNDLKLSVEITLEEAASGVEKTVKYKRNGKCSACNGTGAEKGSKMKTCPTCNGAGRVKVVQRTPLGSFQSEKECSECHGKGEIPEKKCKTCHGTGIHKETVEKTIKIPAGIDDSQKMRLEGMGEASHNGGPNGDLYLVIRVKRHEIFEREEMNLFVEIPISYSTATLGGEVEVPTLDGKKTMKVPAGTQSGKSFKLSNEGIKSLRGNGKGDLYARIVIETPTNLNSKQKELLKKFESSLKESNYTKKKSLMDKIKAFVNKN